MQMITKEDLERLAVVDIRRLADFTWDDTLYRITCEDCGAVLPAFNATHALAKGWLRDKDVVYCDLCSRSASASQAFHSFSDSDVAKYGTLVDEGNPAVYRITCGVCTSTATTEIGNDTIVDFIVTVSRWMRDETHSCFLCPFCSVQAMVSG